ncbi:MAG: winged helix-turn-helix domain-containing protein [Candidatus ainarchaeum sp.]|nr:winged helix-turn-helix domain-containing protein [Candidatus ainarchaeum sp.]
MKTTPYHLCFETLGNDLRIRILSALAESPKSVQSIEGKTGASQSAVSHALAELKECSFVSSIAIGKERIYNLNSSLSRLAGNAKPGTPAFLSVMEKHFQQNCKNKCRKMG